LESPTEGGASAAQDSRTYKLVSATYREKTYADTLLIVDVARNEIELRQLTGRRKKAQTAIVRLRFEPTSDVLADGPLLRVSGLSMTLESPAKAGEVADILRGPARQKEAMQSLSEAEAAITEFVVSREHAMTFFSRMKVDPRGALLGEESLWAADDKNGPLDAIHATYSARLAVSFEKMASPLAGADKKLGPAVMGRVYALTYTLCAIQDALFDGDFKQDEELSALNELGLAATPQDLRAEKPTERLLLRALPILEGLASGHPPPK